MRLVTALLFTLALAIIAPAQSYSFHPESLTGPAGSIENSYPFGFNVRAGMTYMLRIPAGQLSPLRNFIEDIALWSRSSGNWSSGNVKIAMGHLPATIPCPFNFPGGPGTTTTGDFQDIQTLWDSTVDGALSFSFTSNTWSDLGITAPGRTTFQWNGVSDVGFFITFSNATVTGTAVGGGPIGAFASTSLGAGRTFNTGFAQPISGTGASCDADYGLWLRLRLNCLNPIYQVNSLASSLDIDGLTNNPCDPIVATRCVGLTSALNIASTNIGLPWDLGFHQGAGVPVGIGGITTPNGQIVNLDFAQPTLLFLNNLSFAVPFVSSLSAPIIGVAPGTLSLQQINIDPAQADGFALSALNEWVNTPPGLVTFPGGNDGFTEIPFGTGPLCAAPVSFYGTTYTSLWVNDNGHVSFTAGTSDFWPSAATFVSQMPRIAGLWADLDASQGGSIAAAATPTSLLISYAGVPEITAFGLATGGVANFDIFFDTSAGSVSITNYVADPMISGSTLAGITPGMGAIDPGSTLFSNFLGLGVQAGMNPMNALYQEVMQGAPSGYSTIVFPNSDGSAFQVF